MVKVATQRRENIGETSSNPMDAGGKYVRYTPEQVEALERAYAECPNPSASRRQQLVRDCPILATVEQKHIKFWFQNRRCREKKRTETSRLMSINRKLTSVNKLLMEENHRLQKQVSQLVYENGHIRQQLLSAVGKPADGNCSSASTTLQSSLIVDTDNAGLLVIAEKTLAEFLSKATGTAMDWVQMPGMKPGPESPDSVGIYVTSQNGGGVAARACGLVGLEPPKIAELLKDRPSWFKDCRSHEVFASAPTANGGTIELVYTQIFAPIVLTPARDLWTLRYTTLLENGSIVVCERSLSGCGTAPSASDYFVRAEMFPSGYLIRSCDGGGSILHIVDHLNLEPWSVPVVLQPLYISSKLVAHRMTIAALSYVCQIARETSGELAYEFGRHPAVLRTFSQRLSRGFNDAVNGFGDAGWSVMNYDGADGVIIAANSTKNLKSLHNATSSLSMPGGILCAKASMLLRNVPPTALVQFLREHHAEWADYNADAYSSATMKTNSAAFPGLTSTSFNRDRIISSLGHTIEDKEMLEVVRIEGRLPGNAPMSNDIHLLQMYSVTDENSTAACAELIFAPINEFLPDNVPLVASGFCIFPMESQSSDIQGQFNGYCDRDLTIISTAQASDGVPAQDMLCVLTIAFQFPFESNLQDSVATTSRQYVHNVITVVQRFAMAIAPTEISQTVGPKFALDTPGALTLAQWMCLSYRFYFGTSLLRADALAGDLVLQQIWHHSHALLCFSIKAELALIFANQAGLNMLETTLVGLQDISLDKIFDEIGREALCFVFRKIMKQGFSNLPEGMCLSTQGRPISYKENVAWKVMAGDEDTAHYVALSFINWTFL